MSILTTNVLYDQTTKLAKSLPSQYKPTQDEKDALRLVLDSFQIGYNNMHRTYREFNDRTVPQRMSIDQQSWNTYQPYDGNYAPGDEMYAWKSNAIRPIVRNRAISIAAHATSRLIFPKIYAQNQHSDEDQMAAQTMMDLVEWTAEQSNYPMTFLKAVIAALVDPCVFIHSEYIETYKTVRGSSDPNDVKYVLDEDNSGFIDTVVPCDEVYIEDPYQDSVQKQGFIIWRKIISYAVAKNKYEHKCPDKFKFVTAGKQCLLADDDTSFYYERDTELDETQVEEIHYWNTSKDLHLVTVNGVLMTDAFNPNPRLDKRLPWTKFGYEIIGKNFFYYKSLVFKMGPDARIINSIYPMIIDGTYLSIFPPLVAIGDEEIGSDVIIPGSVTTLSSPDSDVKALNVTGNLLQGMSTLMDVEKSLNQSSSDPVMGGAQERGNNTAFEISKMQQNAATVLGLFVKMISDGVKQYGTLRVADIIQYMTVADVREVAQGNQQLVYKTFLMPDRDSNGKTKTRKIEFDLNLPNHEITEEELLEMSLELLSKEGGLNAEKEIYKVNPGLFRSLKYTIKVVPDVLNPMSEELERAFKLEEYDRAINNPLLDQEMVTRDFLLRAFPESKKNPDKYILKKQSNLIGSTPGQQMMQQGNGANPAIPPSAADTLASVAETAGEGTPRPQATIGASGAPMV